MPNYRYVAVNDSGAVQSGRMSAVSSAEVRETLRNNGLFATRVRRLWWNFERGTENSLSPAELLSFTRELATLLRGGVTLPSAIGLLADTLNGFPSGVLRRVQGAIEEGSSPSTAFMAQGRAFDPTFVQMVGLGEKTGDLSGALDRYTTYLRRQTAIRSKIRQASYYPVVLLGVVALAVSVLLLFSVPRFAQMYDDLGTPLPSVTSFLLVLSNYFPLVVLFFVGVGMAVRFGNRERVARLLLRLPLIRDVFAAYVRAKIMRAFSILLASGMTAVTALESTADTIKGTSGEHLHGAAQRIASGDSLSRALAETGILTATGLRLIEVAQQTGTLPTQAAAIAEFYEEDLDNLLVKAVALLEPMMILLMGFIIGAIVLAMYLPVFNLTAAVQ